MRYLSFSVVACTLLLAACSKQAGLPAEDVLKRSSVANSGLVSARLVVTARVSSTDIQTGSVDASVIVEGNMQQGGNQLDLAFNTTGTQTSMAQSLKWTAGGRLIVVSSQESYLTLEQVETTPQLPMLALPEFENFIGTWFRLPGVQSASPTLTPDPRLLRLQSDSVRVTKDRGLVTMDGRSMYHYDVAIDPQRLAGYLAETSAQNPDEAMLQLQQLAKYDASGQLWIDAETFLLTKAVWNISEKGKNEIILTLSMSISNPGLQVVVTAPKESEPFPQLPVFPSGDATILQEF